MNRRGWVGLVLLVLGLLALAVAGYVFLTVSMSDELQLRIYLEGGRSALQATAYGSYAGMGIGAVLFIIGLVLLIKSRRTSHAG